MISFFQDKDIPKYFCLNFELGQLYEKFIPNF
jgi:hypothetical protein